MPAPASPPRRDWTALLVAAGLVLVPLALYARTHGFEFVSLDDYFVLVQRPIVSNGLSWAGVGWAFTTLEPDWYPLTWLSHLLCFSLFGADAGGHHLVNAALHAAGAALLFAALRGLGAERWPSALVAGLFALHPLRVESVAWVTERKDVMSGLWWMLALLAYGRYARRPSAARYALLLAAFAGALMAKPMVVTLPLVLLLLDYWPLARGGLGARRLLLEKAPLLGLGLAVAATTLLTASGGGGVRSLDQVSLAWRLINVPIGYWVYLRQTVWPAGLAAFYPHPANLAGVTVTDYVWPALAAAALLAGVTALCLALRRSRPYLLVGWLWYLLTLLPVIGLLAVGRQWHADRFTYLPTIGLYIMAAWALRDAVARRPALRRPAVAAAAVALAALAALSWRQIGTWRDSRTLFEHAVAATDDNYFAHQTLGATLRAAGDLDAARVHLDAALRLSPESAYAVEQLGLLLEAQGDRGGAAAAYERALALSQRSFHARRNLAALRAAEGRWADAAALLAAALEHEPANGDLRFDLGTALLQERRYADAAAELERAVALLPHSANAHNNLGVALAQQGRYAEAVPQFERALALNPRHAMAATSLAWARRQIATPAAR